MGKMVQMTFDDDLEQLLRNRAAANGRSLDVEVVKILRSAVGAVAPEKLALMEELTRFRATLEGRFHTPAAELVRESRDVDAR